MPTYTYNNQGDFTITQSVTGPGGLATQQKGVTVEPVVSNIPVIRGTGTTFSNTSGALSVPVASGTVQGDLIILVLAQRATQPTFTVPAVWNAQGEPTLDATRSQYMAVYTRVAGSTPGSITVTSSSTSAFIGWSITVANGTYSTNYPLNVLPIGWFTSSATSTTVPDVITTSDSAVRVALLTELFGTVAPSFTASGTWNGDGTVSTTAAGNNLASFMEHKTTGAAGATGAPTVTSTAGNVWSGTEFVINPPAGNPPYVKPQGTRFAGDPGVGKWYIGGTADPYLGLSRHDSLDFWQDQMSAQNVGTGAKTRKLGIFRIYSTGGPSWAEIDWALGRRMIPNNSWFPSGGLNTASTWTAYTNGNQDTVLSNIYAEFKKRHPDTPVSGSIPKGYIWYSAGGHEPEDNITDGTVKTAYRAMKRYVYKYFANRFAADGLTPNVAHCDVHYMAMWTIVQDNFSHRDWRTWLTDYKGTSKGTPSAPDIADFYTGTESCVDILGLDHYQGASWWLGDPISAYSTTWFHDTMTQITNRVGLLNKPICIGESGFRNPQTGHFTGTEIDPANGQVIQNGWVPDAGSFDDTKMQAFMDNIINNIDTFDLVGYEYWNSVKTISGTPTGVQGENRFEALTNGSYDPHQSRYKGFAKWADDPRTVRL